MIDKIKKRLLKNKLVYKLYLKRNASQRTHGKYKFISRSKDSKDLCIILAGYKGFLWDEVFYRIKKFAPPKMDVCVISSGLFSNELNEICEKNQWSYLSTKDNKVTLAQNIAVKLFPKAENIFKLDEDILICKNFFNGLKDSYEKIEKETRLIPGMILPILPINGFGHIKFLEKLNLLDDFEKKFGKTYYSSSADNKIMLNVDMATYIWEKSFELDKLAAKFYEDEFNYFDCPIRISIGAIFFKRDFFEKMGMFTVDSTNGLGLDEVQICSYCLVESRPIVVCGNILAGHFCFGPQNEAMKKMYLESNMLRKLNSEDTK